MRCTAISLTFVVGLLVSGCVNNIAAVEGISAALTDKAASDHFVSLMSGKDCSFLRVERGRSYCVEDARIANQSHLYCYRTLGAVTCYTEPDAQRVPSERIGYMETTAAQQ